MIEIKNLSFSYDNVKDSLKDVNMLIKDGSWVSIVGHNGSGKSTLAKLLVGLNQPKTGNITIDGDELNEKNIDSIRQKIGIVFQNPDNQFVGVTVRNDIAFGLENRNVSRDEMNKLVIENAFKVGLEDYLDKEPHNLSGGEKQRVAIAGILALDLKYIIFDEATSMLDPKGVSDVTKLIKELSKDKNKTIITITHDLALAGMSDYVFVFNGGSISLEGKPSEVFAHEEVLNNSNLDIPLSLKLYNAIKKDNKLNKNERLVKALCQLSSTK